MAQTVTSIAWLSDINEALGRASTEGKLALIECSQAPRCAGSVRLRAEVYPTDAVTSFVMQHFVATTFIRSDRPQDAQRLNVIWTPTVVMVEPDRTERHRIVGYLPPVEFLAQLEMGVAKATFGRERYVEAQHAFEEIVRRYPKTYATPEADYWAGVSHYKQERDRSWLKATAERLTVTYPNTEWATKASVWA
jgi:hypothetical protein